MKVLDKIKKFFPPKEAVETAKSENILAFQKSETEGAFAVLGALAASIEHDITTPVANLRTDILHLRKLFANDVRASAVLDRMEHSIQRIRACAKIISLSRAAPEYNEHLNNTINLEDLINTCIWEIKRELDLDAEKIFFRTNFKNKDIFVNGHTQTLGQVIVNILKNAVEAIYETGKNRGTVEINVLREPDSDVEVRIEIVDDGIGIPEENIRELTGLFTTKEKANGGLGLFIANKLIKIHRGEIRFKSELGKGTTVSIILPRYKTKKEIKKESDFSDDSFDL